MRGKCPFRLVGTSLSWINQLLDVVSGKLGALGSCVTLVLVGDY